MKHIKKVSDINDSDNILSYPFIIKDDDGKLRWAPRLTDETGKIVDLGLSILWTTCNIGANTSVGIGNYYAWGEITPKNEYRWNNYKYANGFYDTLTKYCPTIIDEETGDYEYWGGIEEPDNKDTLDSSVNSEFSDDITTVVLGDTYRMPTATEFLELIDNSNISETDNYNNSGIGGKIFTSKINGNQLFIPFSGSKITESSYEYKNTGFRLWSSNNSSTWKPYQSYYLFCDGDVEVRNKASREVGCAVRAVKEITVESSN